MRFLYFGLVLLSVCLVGMAYEQQGQPEQPNKPETNKPEPSKPDEPHQPEEPHKPEPNHQDMMLDMLNQHGQLLSMSHEEIAAAIEQIKGDIADKFHDAIKHHVADFLNIDKSVLDNSSRHDEAHHVLLEKLIDEVNYKLYKMQPNVSDSYEDHMNYFRLDIHQKINLLVHNFVLAAHEKAKDFFEPKEDEDNHEMIMDEKEVLEEHFLKLVKKLFHGIEQFIEDAERKGDCKDLKEFKQKVEHIKRKMHKIVKKVRNLEETADEDDKEAQEEIQKLKECFGKLLSKVLNCIDGFFKKNAHNKEIDHYRKAFYKLKCKLVKIGKRLEELEAEKQFMQEDHEEDSDESDEEENNSHLQELEHKKEKLEEHFLLILKELFHGAEEFFKKNEKSACKELEKLEAKINHIKGKMIKIVKKVKHLEANAEDDDEEAQAEIAELRECFSKLLKKLLFTIDCFFKKNAHNENLRDDAKDYRRIKCKLLKVLKKIEEIEAEEGAAKQQHQKEEKSDEEENNSDEDSDEENNEMMTNDEEDHKNENPKELLMEIRRVEDAYLKILKSMFEGIHKFFEENSESECKGLEELEKKINHIEKKLKKIVKIGRHIEENSDIINDSEARQKLENLGVAFRHLIENLFEELDNFFKKNGHNLKQEQKEYHKVKRALIKLDNKLKELEAELKAELDDSEEDEDDENKKKIQAIEEKYLSLLEEIFKGIEQFKKDNQNSGCEKFEEFIKKAEHIGLKLHKIVTKARLLEKHSDEDDHEAQAELNKLRECFEKLVHELFETIDAFFEENSDNEKLQEANKSYCRIKAELHKLEKERNELLNEDNSDEDEVHPLIALFKKFMSKVN